MTFPINLRKILGNRFTRRERLFWITAIPFTLMIVVAMGFFLTRPQPVEPPLPPVPPPEKPDVVSEIVAAYESGDRAGAEALLKGVDVESSTDPKVWALAGLLAEARGDDAAAVEIYKRGIARCPSPGLFCRRAVLYLEAGNPEAALADLEEAIPLDRSDNFLPNARLLVLIQLGRTAEARAEIDRQHGVMADAGPWVFGLAAIALESAEFPQAAELLALGRQAVGPEAYRALLSLAPISRYQTHPAILPFFIENPAAE